MFLFGKAGFFMETSFNPYLLAAECLSEVDYVSKVCGMNDDIYVRVSAVLLL